MIERAHALWSRDERGCLRCLRLEIDHGLRSEWPGEVEPVYTRPDVDTQPVEVTERGGQASVEWL